MDRVHESRALGVQARSLEVLQTLGLGEVLVRRGNTSARLVIHLDTRRVAEARLGEFGVTDTRFPFILFVSQAETEAVLGNHLASVGVVIERGVELLDGVPEPDCVRCLLRHPGGKEEQVRTRYLAGCDGAHSTVRKRAGISFEGDAYLQDFMLGDVEVGGLLERAALHSFALRRGVAMFFPLGSPSTAVIAARCITACRLDHATGRPHDTSDLRSRAEKALAATRRRLIAVCDRGEDSSTDPAHHSQLRPSMRAAHYRRAHILARRGAQSQQLRGAQGRLGIRAWKLGSCALGRPSTDCWMAPVRGGALASRAPAAPVHRSRIHRCSRGPSPGGRLATWLRRVVVARVLPRIFASSRLRAYLFHLVSQLGIRYRNSPAVTEGEPRLGVGPKAGDRFPDAKIEHNGRQTYLQRTRRRDLHLVLAGRATAGTRPRPPASLPDTRGWL